MSDGPVRPLGIAMVGACPFPTPQGSQVLIRQSAEALGARGHRVTVLAYHVGNLGIPVRVPVLRTPGVPRYRHLGSGPSWGKTLLDPLLAARLWRLVRAEPIDIVHAHGYEAALIALAVGRAARVPIVYHGHAALEDELPTYFAGVRATALARRVGGAFDALVPRQARHCIAVTPALRARLVTRGSVPPERVTWLAPGVGFEPVSPELREATARRLGLDGHPLVVYTGNLDRYQRLDLLLAGLPTLFARVPGARVAVVTHGAASSGLSRTDRRLVVLPYASFVEVRALLSLAAAAVVPRTCPYGFPVKLLNALAAGTPTVAFRASVPFLDEEPPALMLVDEPEGPALGAALATLLENPGLRAQLGARGQALARRRFDLGTLTEALERIYASVTQPEVCLGSTRSL